MKHLLTVICFLCITTGRIALSQDLDTSRESVNSVHMQPDRQKPSAVDDINIEKKFDLMYASLKDTYSGYIVDAMKTLAFLIIAIGWFITSDKSREFLRKNRSARIAMIAAAVILCLIHIRDCVLTCLLSERKLSLLSDLNFIEREYFYSYEISPAMLSAYLIQNVVLFVCW